MHAHRSPARFGALFLVSLLIAACLQAPVAFAQDSSTQARRRAPPQSSGGGDTGAEGEPPLSCCATIRCAAGYKCVCNGNSGGCAPDPAHSAPEPQPGRPPFGAPPK
jgi:hypothetical protein